MYVLRNIMNETCRVYLNDDLIASIRKVNSISLNTTGWFVSYIRSHRAVSPTLGTAAPYTTETDWSTRFMTPNHAVRLLDGSVDFNVALFCTSSFEWRLSETRTTDSSTRFKRRVRRQDDCVEASMDLRTALHTYRAGEATGTKPTQLPHQSHWQERKTELLKSACLSLGSTRRLAGQRVTRLQRYDLESRVSQTRPGARNQTPGIRRTRRRRRTTRRSTVPATRALKLTALKIGEWPSPHRRKSLYLSVGKLILAYVDHVAAAWHAPRCNARDISDANQVPS